MSYTFDDIKGPITLLVDLYCDANAAETAVGRGKGKPVVSEQILMIIGALRQPLNGDDQQRFDLIVDRLIEAKINGQHGSLQ